MAELVRKSESSILQIPGQPAALLSLQSPGKTHIKQETTRFLVHLYCNRQIIHNQICIYIYIYAYVFMIT